MVKVLSDKMEAKIFTCGIYGNYPFEELLRHRCVEVLKCVNVVGSETLKLTSLIEFVHFRPHVVIIFGIESIAGIMVYFLSRLVKAKTVVIVEENNITTHNNFILDFLQKLKMQIVKYIYKRAPILIAESDASKRYVIEILHVKRNKPIIVRVHGIDTSKYLRFTSMPKIQAKKEILKLLELPENLLTKKWCVFIGEPSFTKGADILIDAIDIFYKQSPEASKDVVFLLPYMPLLRDMPALQLQYQRKLNELLLKGIVVLYRPIYPELMPLFYRAVDIVVVPSRLFTYMSSDRAPNVTMEALASGNIVIASYAGGIPTIVRDSGILIKPNDPQVLSASLKNILQNLDTYMCLQQKGRTHALYLFDVNYYVLHILNYLKKIL
jgi:glycosyltransferase involved in cell wall biosynthesis